MTEPVFIAPIVQRSRASASGAIFGGLNIIILAEIPYDNAVPKAIARAKPVVSAYPDAESSRTIRNLSDKLKKIVL